jgi:hypothetical protein
MSEASSRLRLPLIQPGQAQKELYHNEALLLVDGLLHAAVEGDPAAVPPVAPDTGQCWIVAAAPTGAWSGHAGALAIRTDGGWRFASPVPGMLVWNKAAGHWLHFSGNGWSSGAIPATSIVIGGEQVVGPRQPEVPSASGGTTIDAEARAAIDLLIVALRSHGLID